MTHKRFRFTDVPGVSPMSLELLGRKELRRDPVAKHIQERIAILN